MKEIIILEGKKPKKPKNNSKEETINLVIDKEEKVDGTTINNKT